MVRRYPPLSERQLKVLAWVADGCPDGVWEDFTYKHTTYALADRGLVTVDRRRHHWSTQLTDQGRYYLGHGTFPPEPVEAETPRIPEKPTARARWQSKVETSVPRRPANGFAVSPTDLVAELQAKDGTLTITDPAAGVRAAYRSSINRAITDGLVPDRYVLRHKGRDHGDLVIRLLPRDETEPVREQLDPIAVPESLHGSHATVRELRDHHSGSLDVGHESRQRALLILQAIAEECVRRGYDFGLRADGQPTFQITVGDDIVFTFVMSEEYERREVPVSDELAAAKYEWQRVRATVQQVRSGRLVIRVGERYSSVSWADRKRWTLVDKLPQLFEHVEQSAIQIAEERARAKIEREQRHQAWENALVQARKDYVADLNRQRLDKQLADSTRAGDLRRYADQIHQRATDLDDPNLVKRVEKWATWVRAEADRTDPLHRSENLVWVEPEEIGPTDLDSFMPRGMNAWRPPD